MYCRAVCKNFMAFSNYMPNFPQSFCEDRLLRFSANKLNARVHCYIHCYIQSINLLTTIVFQCTLKIVCLISEEYFVPVTSTPTIEANNSE